MTARKAGRIGIVIFDLMDTVVIDPFYRVAPEVLGMSWRELLDLKHPTAWQDFERGVIDEACFFQRFFKQPPPLSVPPLSRLKHQMLAECRPVDGVFALLSQLKQRGIKLWMLSNYSCWFEQVREQFDLDRFFAGFTVSYRSGYRKPAPQAYQAVERDTGYAAAECLLIDDRPVNIEGARRVGMSAARFVDVPTLRRELQRCGLLERSETSEV